MAADHVAPSLSGELPDDGEGSRAPGITDTPARESSCHGGARCCSGIPLPSLPKRLFHGVKGILLTGKDTELNEFMKMLRQPVFLARAGDGNKIGPPQKAG